MSKQKNNRTRGGGLIVLILLIAAAMAGVLLRSLSPGETPAPNITVPRTTAAPASDPEQTVPQTTQAGADFLFDLGDELYIASVNEFAGIYMEDGTDEPVQGLLSLVLENRGELALQYARIILDYGDARAEFEVTNLPAGGTVVLLEKNRMPYRAGLPGAAAAENTALLEEFPMYPELFEINTADGVINIRNVSDEDITGDIFVYYKNVGGGIYYGGITYRVRIAGGLKAGEIRQVMTGHYYEDASEILMVTYGP